MDPGMLSIPNLDYSTPETVLFQVKSVPVVGRRSLSCKHSYV